MEESERFQCKLMIISDKIKVSENLCFREETLQLKSAQTAKLTHQIFHRTFPYGNLHQNTSSTFFGLFSDNLVFKMKLHMS